jgi:hypothetical protein
MCIILCLTGAEAKDQKFGNGVLVDVSSMYNRRAKINNMKELIGEMSEPESDGKPKGKLKETW